LKIKFINVKEFQDTPGFRGKEVIGNLGAGRE
jgi:hypothetical protein